MSVIVEHSSAVADTAVVYYSGDDGCWVADSLRTSQIGTGGSIVDALADLVRALEWTYAVAREDSSIAWLRPASADIQELAGRAEKLPVGVGAVAYEKAHGRWPDYLTLPTLASGDTGGVFVCEVRGIGGEGLDGLDSDSGPSLFNSEKLGVG